MMTARSRIILSLLLILGLTASAFSASAQSRALEDGPAIRRQLLHRSAKLELQPGVSSLFGNTYQTPLYGSLAVRYNLSNSVSVGLDLHGSPVAVNRRYMNQIRNDDPNLYNLVEVAKTPFVGSFQVTYSPFIGKINFFGKKMTYFDVHVIVGAGGALQSANYAPLAGFKFGPVVGVGARLFLSDGVALVARFTDYIYSNGEAYRAGTTVNERWRSHFMGTIGVSIFFPRAVYISR